MSLPTVICVMLTRGRPEMAARAIRCYMDQTYPQKSRMLYVLDTGANAKATIDALPQNFFTEFGISYHHSLPDQRTIGELRNYANGQQNDGIIIHWDDDDWSAPERIEEQVALLLESRKQCVGYREMLFSRGGEAWIYHHANQGYCVGTSLCYWLTAWQARPFGALPKAKGGTGEDTTWLRGIDSLGVSSLGFKPRMVASIHPGNTQYYGTDLLEGSTSWHRAPEWDGYCAGRMKL